MDQSKIIMGAANIFIGGNAPASGEAMTITATNGVGIPSTGGTNIGYTSGPTTFTVKGSTKEVSAEQSLSPVRVLRQNEEVTIEFSMLEVDFRNMYKFLNGARLYDNASSKVAAVTGGGDPFINTFTVAFTSKDPVPQGQSEYYMGVCLYKAFNDGDFSMPFQKDGETMVKVTLKALADGTRPVGDQTYQIVQQYKAS